MKKIFFSYCQKDEKSLEFIDKFIKETNYDKNDYFLDRNKNTAGDYYWQNIYKAMETTDIFIFFNSDNYFWSGACCKELIWALRLEKAGRLKIIEVKVHANTKINEFDNCKIYVNLDDPKLIEKLWLGITKNEFGGFEKKKLIKNIQRTYDGKKINLKLKLSKTLNFFSIALFWPTKNEQNFADLNFSPFSLGSYQSKDRLFLTNEKETYNVFIATFQNIYSDTEYEINLNKIDQLWIGFHDPCLGSDEKLGNYELHEL